MYSDEELVDYIKDNVDSDTTSSKLDELPGPSSKTLQRRIGSMATIKSLAGVNANFDRCQICGKETGSLGIHWSKAGHYPELNEYRKNLLQGMFIGDGTVEPQYGENAKLQFKMVNKEFLHWLDEELANFSTGVRLASTSEERSRRNRKSGFNKQVDASNYSDSYIVGTRRHPHFNKYSEWYEDGSKVLQQDIVLSEISLKMWYISDGSLSKEKYPVICLTKSEEDKLSHIFSKIGFDITYSSGKIRFPSQNRKFFEYIGDPVPGFEYKWPTQ